MKYAGLKKVFLSPTVRFYRTRCCTKEDHCTNMDTAGYRRGMLSDLVVIKDAMLEFCRDEGIQLYKVLGSCELLGLKAAMEEDEVERLLGSHTVHMTDEGYVTMAEQLIKLISNPTQLFVGEKREREEYSGPAEVGGWRRKTHEWLFNVAPAPRRTTATSRTTATHRTTTTSRTTATAIPEGRQGAAKPQGGWAMDLAERSTKIRVSTVIMPISLK